jgi:hypothetical protein
MKTQRRIYAEYVVSHMTGVVQLARYLEMTVPSVCCLAYHRRGVSAHGRVISLGEMLPRFPYALPAEMDQHCVIETAVSYG